MAHSPAIDIVHASIHNLQIRDLQIPLHSLVAICGPSGAGKSSLLFGVLAAAAEHRYRHLLDSSVQERPRHTEVSGLPFSIALRGRRARRSWLPSAASEAGIYQLLAQFLLSLPEQCRSCGSQLQRQTMSELRDFVATPPNTARFLQIEVPLASVEALDDLRAQGFSRIRYFNDEEWIEEHSTVSSTIDQAARSGNAFLIIDRFSCPVDFSRRALRDSLKLARGLSPAVQVLRFLDEQAVECGSLSYSDSLRCPGCGLSLQQLTQADLDFRNEGARCPECRGEGARHLFAPQLLWGPEDAPLPLGGVRPWMQKSLRPDESVIAKLLAGLHLDSKATLGDLSMEKREILLFGEHKHYQLFAPPPLEGSDENVSMSGVCGLLRREYFRSQSSSVRRRIEAFLFTEDCARCSGARLRPETIERVIGGRQIRDVMRFSFGELGIWLRSAAGSGDEKLLHSVTLLESLGLDYLCLSQSFITLSTGERDRLRLSRGIFSELKGVLYLLDSPLAGLFPSDRKRMTSVFRQIVTNGNSVIAAENDSDFSERADWICKLGPGSGSAGGRVVRTGPPRQPSSFAPMPPSSMFQPKAFLRFSNFSKRNIHELSFSLPLASLSVIAGPSGSGKSTLLHEVIVPEVRSALQPSVLNSAEFASAGKLSGLGGLCQAIDLGGTAVMPRRRGTVASLAGLLPPLHDFFARLPEAKIAGSAAEARYRGKQMSELVELTVSDSLALLKNIPPLSRILRRVEALGLGYLRLNQPATSLSEGELQRILLLRAVPRSLFRDDSAPTLLAFDEPVRGLLDEEVDTVVRLFRELIANGHTVVVVEHELRFLAQSDYILELGPGGGPNGGTKVAEGLTETIRQDSRSFVGKLLVGFTER